MKFRVFWDVLQCSQTDVDRRFRGKCCLHHQGDRPDETVRTSETSVNISLTTRQYIVEDSELHTRRRENLKFWLEMVKESAICENPLNPNLVKIII
jgi:hypothetical protein